MLEEVMYRTEAWELARDPDYTSRLRMDGFERLMLRAGYSADDAHRAAMQHGWARLSAGEMM